MVRLCSFCLGPPLICTNALFLRPPPDPTEVRTASLAAMSTSMFLSPIRCISAVHCGCSQVLRAVLGMGSIRKLKECCRLGDDRRRPRRSDTVREALESKWGSAGADGAVRQS